MSKNTQTQQWFDFSMPDDNNAELLSQVDWGQAACSPAYAIESGSSFNKNGRGSLNTSISCLVNDVKGTSADMASWFLNTQYGVGYESDDQYTGSRCIATTFKANAPQKLYFAIQGTLTLKTASVTYTNDTNIFLGQGDSGGGHNWWLGSQQMCGISWTKPTDDDSNTEMAKAALKLARDIITDDYEGLVEEALKMTVDLIKKAFTKRQVGSALIPFRTDKYSNAVELLYFQMTESGTIITATGTYMANSTPGVS